MAVEEDENRMPYSSAVRRGAVVMRQVPSARRVSNAPSWSRISDVDHQQHGYAAFRDEW